MNRAQFEDYIKGLPKDKIEVGMNWLTSVGLQDVDGLSSSEYLLDLAIENIEGKLSFEEVELKINEYYVRRE